MLNKNKVLCLFTLEFPYGNKSETFLETEIKYLEKHFSTILIFPSFKCELIRPLPNKVKVIDICEIGSIPKYEKINILITNLFLVCQLLVTEIIDKGFFKVFNGQRILLNYLIQQIKIRDILLQYLQNDFKNKVFYDYWFCDKVLALSLIKKKYKKLKFISRGHGFDIYDERWPKSGIPFRAWKIKYIDLLIIISQFGQRYVRKKVPSKYKEKIQHSYLGVEKNKQQILKSTDNFKTIVSCSSMLPFKNVDKIPLLLRELNLPIHWFHFGDGIDKPKVEKACEQLPQIVEFKLMGHVDNIQLIDFYRQNKVNLFLSLSQSEGLPFSMMEVLSFGIPIVAYPVGGIPELVIDGKTGFLLPKTGDISMSALVLKKALNFNFNYHEIIQFYENHFNAERNYLKFIEKYVFT